MLCIYLCYLFQILFPVMEVSVILGGTLLVTLQHGVAHSLNGRGGHRRLPRAHEQTQTRTLIESRHGELQ